jgi:hypothetical protein
VHDILALLSYETKYKRTNQHPGKKIAGIGIVSIVNRIVPQPALKNIKACSVRFDVKHRDLSCGVVGGWYDNEDLYGALKTYQHIERSSVMARLVITNDVEAR